MEALLISFLLLPGNTQDKLLMNRVGLIWLIVLEVHKIPPAKLDRCVWRTAMVGHGSVCVWRITWLQVYNYSARTTLVMPTMTLGFLLDSSLEDNCIQFLLHSIINLQFGDLTSLISGTNSCSNHSRGTERLDNMSKWHWQVSWLVITTLLRYAWKKILVKEGFICFITL